MNQIQQNKNKDSEPHSPLKLIIWGSWKQNKNIIRDEINKDKNILILIDLKNKKDLTEILNDKEISDSRKIYLSSVGEIPDLSKFNIVIVNELLDTRSIPDNIKIIFEKNGFDKFC